MSNHIRLVSERNCARSLANDEAFRVVQFHPCIFLRKSAAFCGRSAFRGSRLRSLDRVRIPDRHESDRSSQRHKTFGPQISQIDAEKTRSRDPQYGGRQHRIVVLLGMRGKLCAVFCCEMHHCRGIVEKSPITHAEGCAVKRLITRNVMTTLGSDEGRRVRRMSHAGDAGDWRKSARGF